MSFHAGSMPESLMIANRALGGREDFLRISARK
jgi:hypothetical protein